MPFSNVAVEKLRVATQSEKLWQRLREFWHGKNKVGVKAQVWKLRPNSRPKRSMPCMITTRFSL